MAIASTDILIHLSGGAANTDPNASLGGAISSTQVTDATLHNLFDIVGSSESSAGDVEYRCFYVKNNHGTLTLQAAKAWLFSNTPSGDTSVQIALGSAAVNGVEQTVADESTAPTGVTFTDAASEGAAQSIGDIPAGQHKAIWMKRTINAGAAAYNADQAVVRVKGDTAA